MNSVLIGPSWSAPPVESLVGALLEGADDDGPWLSFHRGARRDDLSRAAALALGARWARALREAGVMPGARVIVVQPNEAAFVGAFLGAQLAGAVPVPLAWPLLAGASKAATVLEPLMRAADPAVVATQPGFAPQCRIGVPVVTAPAASALAFTRRADADSAAFIQFTSGTTSRPRGAVITHRAAVASAWAMGRALGLGAADVGVAWLPLFHDMGLIGVMLCSLLWRFPMELLTPAEFLLRPTRWLELLAATRATVTVAPNFGYELAARRCDGAFAGRLDALRLALSGAEPVHRTTIDGFERRFASNGVRPGTILPVYGLAENTLGVCFAGADDRAPDLRWQGRLVPSVGRPLAGTEVAIRDAGGRDVAAGLEGEVVVRGPSLMSGYFRDAEATAEALSGGWLRTGDLGVVHGGSLHVTGREKDLVIKAGRKFHPYEIERVVAEAVGAPQSGVAAFSHQNEASGTEDLVVVIELRRGHDGERDPSRLVRGRLMEELGVRADRVCVVRAGELPRTTSGKVQRRACAQRYGPSGGAPPPDRGL